MKEKITFVENRQNTQENPQNTQFHPLILKLLIGSEQAKLVAGLLLAVLAPQPAVPGYAPL